MRDLKGDADQLGFKVKKCETTLVYPAEEIPRGPYYLCNLDQNKIRLGPNTRAIDMDDPEDRMYLLTSLEENLGMIVCTIYSYETGEKGNENAARVIRDSLAKVIVPFYPFSGRMKVSSEEKLIIECTGEGVRFVEAEADCKVADIGDLMSPNPAILGNLVYDFMADKPKSILDVPLLTVQVTKFKCGGFILGVTMNHAVLDGLGAACFLNAWGEVARGLPPQKPTLLDRTLLKPRVPPRVDFKHPEFDEMSHLLNCDENDSEIEEMEYITFPFGPKRVERIKYKVMEDKVVGRCTTFEALTAFVWRTRAIAMRSSKDAIDKPSKLVFPVDGRSKFNPPLPQAFFGNAIVLTSCTCPEAELIKKPLSYAVSQIQKAIEGVNDAFMRSAIDYYEVTRARPHMRSMVLVTMWARLSFYESDFGWGPPVHSGPIGFPVKEVVMLISDGNDINMMVALPRYAMKKFEEIVNEI